MIVVYSAEAQDEVDKAVDHLIFDRQSLSPDYWRKRVGTEAKK